MPNNSGHHRTLFHRIDARAKFAGLFLLLVILVLPSSHDWLTVGLFAVLLIVLAVVARVRAKVYLQRVAVISPLLIGILLTGMFDPARYGFDNSMFNLAGFLAVITGYAGLIITRTLLALLLVTVLTTSTSTVELIRAMSWFHIPPSIVRSASLTMRYFGVLQDEMVSIRRAMSARGYRPRWIAHAPLLGNVVAALFLRSLARGERVQHAMLARGYGHDQTDSLIYDRFSIADLLFALALPAIVFFIYLVLP